MIRVDRGAEPAALARSRGTWLPRWQAAATDDERRKALGKYKSKPVTAALRAAFHDKCAYCESPTEAASWGHIEHYRPRALFPERALDWDNLLWACPRCNSDCKADSSPKWPKAGRSSTPAPTTPQTISFSTTTPSRGSRPCAARRRGVRSLLRCSNSTVQSSVASAIGKCRDWQCSPGSRPTATLRPPPSSRRHGEMRPRTPLSPGGCRRRPQRLPSQCPSRYRECLCAQRK